MIWMEVEEIISYRSWRSASSMGIELSAARSEHQSEKVTVFSFNGNDVNSYPAGYVFLN